VLSQAYHSRAISPGARALSAFYTAQRQIFDEELIEKTKRLQIIHQVETSKREAALQRAEAEVFVLKMCDLLPLWRMPTIIAERGASQSPQERAALIAAHRSQNPLADHGYTELMMLQMPAEG